MVFLMVILVKSSPSLQKMKIKKMKSKWSYLLMKKKLCINEMNMTIFHMLTVFPFINPKEVNFLSFYYLSYLRIDVCYKRISFIQQLHDDSNHGLFVAKRAPFYKEFKRRIRINAILPCLNNFPNESTSPRQIRRIQLRKKLPPMTLWNKNHDNFSFARPNDVMGRLLL